MEFGGDLIYNEATKGGFFIRPAIFSNVTDDMTISKEEVCSVIYLFNYFKSLPLKNHRYSSY